MKPAKKNKATKNKAKKNKATKNKAKKATARPAKPAKKTSSRMRPAKKSPAPLSVADPTAALGTAAHEIKNALGPLAMTLQLAERRALEGELVAPQDLAFARAQVRRLSRLVNDLLDVTLVDTERLPLRAHPANLAATVEEAIDVFERGNVRQVARALPSSPVSLTFDAERVLQVLLNLLENAAKYAPLPAPIAVSLTRTSGAARVEVRDGGPGLTPDDQRRVFDRFTRAREVDDDTRGLGLGLYLCRAIIERHGGRMGVDSSPGRGATFWFELPTS
ncbi:MAG TPA: HAMP domain-containing sensor histidine kinase [Polyangia bacterium]|nr:HAMP domain-containing sensor histidine kinase [Polyangia bacterium]